MSIVHEARDHPEFSDGTSFGYCTTCHCQLKTPFVAWDGVRYAILRLCKPCCHKIKQGLLRDLTQITAIADEQEPASSGPMTLVVGAGQKKQTTANMPAGAKSRRPKLRICISRHRL